MFERLTKRNSNGDVASHVDPQKRYMLFVNRLAAYEDSGLSPEEVQKMARAKEEGRLVVLPCKLGAKLWFVVTKSKGRKSEHTFVKMGWFCESNFFSVLRSFGKTVFLTREEAEKALQEGLKC